MSKLYGHSHLIALRGEQGCLCYQWIAMSTVSILLFTTPKAANEWLKAAAKHVEMPSLSPVPVSAVPEGVERAVINPSDDAADIRRMMTQKRFR